MAQPKRPAAEPPRIDASELLRRCRVAHEIARQIAEDAAEACERARATVAKVRIDQATRAARGDL